MIPDSERSAVLTLVLLAAFADGSKSDSERAAVSRVVEGLGSDAGLNVWALYQKVLSAPPPLAEVCAGIASRESRLIAYEMAVSVCDADGVPNAAEQAFLADLRRELRLGEEAYAADRQAASVAAAAVPEPAPSPAAQASPPPLSTAVDTAALEKSVLNHSILNAALELLPQSLASVAIVPLQMRMVYSIGKAHGYTLDRGHIRDFIATAGAGMAAQVVEGYARKLVGGLAKNLLGGGLMGSLGRGVLTTGTGAAFTFAATYAIGHLAIRYYAGARKMEAAVLRDTYTRLLSEGRSLFGQHAGAIQSRASTLNPTEVLNLVRSAPMRTGL
jgi:uncharacterized protein (DUF697 family)